MFAIPFFYEKKTNKDFVNLGHGQHLISMTRVKD